MSSPTRGLITGKHEFTTFPVPGNNCTLKTEYEQYVDLQERVGGARSEQKGLLAGITENQVKHQTTG